VTRPVVEVLYLRGCPNHEPALELLRQMSRELGVETDLRVVVVVDQEAAQRLRFLGSPTVRVNARDVEPGANRRTDFAISCRVYRGEEGLAGRPDEAWIRTALTEAAAKATGPVAAALRPAQLDRLSVLRRTAVNAQSNGRG
jgi:hypothetical protein